MYITLTKSEINSLNYSEKAYDYLIPMMLLGIGHSLYGQCGTVTISIETMWLIASKGKRLAKREYGWLVELFQDYTGIQALDYTTEYTFNLKDYAITHGNAFVKLDSQTITTMIGQYGLKKLGVPLTMVLNISSYITGDFIGMDKHGIYEYFKKQAKVCDNSRHLFYMYTTDELLEIARDICCFADIEKTLLTKNTNTDQEHAEPFINRRTFETHMEKLEKLGIICSVSTTQGQFHNKAVFCLVEHKDIVEQLYNELGKRKDYAIKQEQEEPTPTVKGGGSFVQARRDREFR